MKIGIDYLGIGCGCIILNEKNEILLVKRSENARADPGSWARPGGAIEFGETAEEAVRREVKEEVGIDLGEVEFISYFDWIKEENGVKKHWVALGFVAHMRSCDVKNLEKDKHDEVRWFPLDKLPDNVADYTIHSINE